MVVKGNLGPPLPENGVVVCSTRDKDGNTKNCTENRKGKEVVQVGRVERQRGGAGGVEIGVSKDDRWIGVMLFWLVSVWSMLDWDGIKGGLDCKL
ncbi:unnamed protein product [Sphenostylis stenocarpa]|uniref:Uncharacterized protein n=1 Tax=Sphenostylis stenocarpa TaxID=92480 RepID=A0AA86S6U9_9FABA|nr:unnamed protein product [Sphenostylis stenocarpa]